MGIIETMTQLLKDIEAYWTNRAEGYSQVNQDELHSDQKRKWTNLLLKELSDHKKVLDCGTGPGFFAILLAENGYEVTAADYTEEMLEKAKKNAGDLKDKINWKQMDAQHPDFNNNTFDAIVTRNLTWGLEHPDTAYKEWYRILKKGGILLNFDANWYRYLYNEDLKKAFMQDREDVKAENMLDFNDGTDVNEMERIARALPLSKIDRPGWDVDILQKCGFSSVTTDIHIGDKVLSEVEKLNFRSTPVFMIKAIK